MLESWWLWAIGTAGITAFVTMGAVRMFPCWGWLDFPQRYGLTRARKPYPGGVVLSFLALGLLSYWPELRILIPAFGSLFLVSWIDDRRPLPIWIRLLVHLGAALWVVFMANFRIEWVGLPWLGTNLELPGAIAALLTVGWIVILQNALNWFDGVPGLTLGVVGWGAAGLLGLSLWRPELFWDPQHANLPLIYAGLLGIAWGGWFFFAKNKIILGDSGSQTLGFLLAVFAILAGAKIGTTIIILLLPLVDLTFSCWRRIRQKKAPWRGDTNHLHHHLQRQWGTAKTILFLMTLTGIFTTGAIFTQGMSKLVWLGGALGISMILVWHTYREKN